MYAKKNTELPRIPSVKDPTTDQLDALNKSTLEDGTIPNAFLAMAHNARLLKRFNVLGGYFARFAVLPTRMSKLIILRTAHRAGNLYEFAMHRQMALSSQVLSKDEVDGVVRNDFQWTPEEAACLEVVDQLFNQHCVSDATWDRLSNFFSYSILIEILLLVGFYQGLAGFLNSARVPLDDRIQDRDWPYSRTTRIQTQFAGLSKDG